MSITGEKFLFPGINDRAADMIPANWEKDEIRVTPPLAAMQTGGFGAGGLRNRFPHTLSCKRFLLRLLARICG